MAEFDITAEIVAVLKQYTGETMDKVDRAVHTCTDGMKKDIAADSPKRKGDYSKGWRTRYKTVGRGNTSGEAYNKTNYQLTHLLERRHRKRGHKGYKDPHPHIGPAEKKWTAKFEQQCEEACKGQ